MRLTLRTLLAYLDDVLAPSEASELRHRIEESEFASTLVQRIRHTLQRLRLNAPKVDGRGLGLDANSVAEYLDSNLPADSMAEFEKICLESDVHLAEIAACHQILAKVLSEPANVPDTLRDHILQLKDLGPRVESHRNNGATSQGSTSQLEEKHSEGASSVEPPLHEPPVAAPPVAAEETIAASKPAVTGAPPIRPKLEVPDYLKPEPRKTSPASVLGVISLLAAIAAVVLLFVGPLKEYNPLLNSDNTKLANNEEPKLEPPVDNSKTNTETDTTPGDKVAAVTPDDEMATEPEKTTPDNSDGGPDGPATTTPPETTPPDPMPAESTAENPLREGEPVASAEKPAEPKEGEPEGSGSTEAPPLPKPPQPATVEPPTGGIGRFISDETLLARLSEGANKTVVWDRVSPRDILSDNALYISLPVYRPQITLSSGVQITAVGEGEFAFQRADEEGVLGLRATYGRYLLHTIGLANVRTNLDLAGIRGTLNLGAADADVAIEVVNYLPPGGDPALASKAIVHLIALEGPVKFTSGGKEYTIKPKNVLVLTADEEPQKVGPIVPPDWIDPRKTSTLDRDASKIVEGAVPFDRSLILTLEEMRDHRRLDVRVQVARCLACLEKYDLIISHLDDEAYRAFWIRYLDTLRMQVARGGDTAKRLEDQLILARGEKEGSGLYRMLLGYSPEQLSDRAAGDLVENLSYIKTIVRVFSIDSLRRITGSQHLYNAGQPPDRKENRTAITKWQNLLKDGEIVYAKKPGPTSDYRLADEPK